MTKLRIQLDNMPTGYLIVFFFSFHKNDKKNWRLICMGFTMDHLRLALVNAHIV